MVKHYVIEAPDGARLAFWRRCVELPGAPHSVFFSERGADALRFPDRCAARFVRAHLHMWPTKILRVSERTQDACNPH